MPDINVSEQTEVTEKLTNTKPWFNGVHKFSSIKVSPPQEQPSKLSISVQETVKIIDQLA